MSNTEQARQLLGTKDLGLGLGTWIKTEDALPKIGKLVYTRSSSGLVGAYTRTKTGWNSWVSVDNDDIVEWFSPYGGGTPVLE